MNVKPIASPAQLHQPQSNAKEAKARAVAAFNQQASPQPEPQIVQNQTSVQPEEMGAIQAQSGQNDIIEETVEITGESEVVETPPEPAKDPALSRQFAQLARQEKVMRLKAQQQDQAIKQREAALATREAAIEAQSNQYKTGYISQEQLKRDLMGTLAEQGITYDDVVQQAMNQQQRDPRTEGMIQKLEAKIQALEESNKTAAQRMTESQQQQYEAAVKQIRTDAKQLVYTDPAFEMIKATGSVKDVVELITRTYDKDGVLLTVEEAAQQVEDYLVEEATKLSRVDKIKKRLQQQSATSSNTPVAAKVQTPNTNKQPPQMKTLTNANASSRQLTAKERAILAFKGELK